MLPFALVGAVHFVLVPVSYFIIMSDAGEYILVSNQMQWLHAPMNCGIHSFYLATGGGSRISCSGGKGVGREPPKHVSKQKNQASLGRPSPPRSFSMISPFFD